MENKKIKKFCKNEEEDYIYRFELFAPFEDNPDEKKLKGELEEMIRKIIISLLKIVVFTHNGNEVKINGFKLIGRDENFEL